MESKLKIGSIIWSVAWRNIWRNRLRSVVVILAIAIGIFAGSFTWAFYRGMVNQRIQSAIITESSHIQVHQKDYLVNPDQKFFIPNLDSILAEIGRLPGVKAVSSRTLVNAMISSAETGAGVRIMGIDPDKERQVTNMFSRIREGTYFESRNKTPVVIGEALAEKLSVRLRSRIVLTLQTMDGTITTALFRVEGIYRTTNTMYDEMNVFVRHSDISRLIGLDGSSGHELAILLSENDNLDNMTARVRANYPALDTRTWREIMPEVGLVEESTDMSMYIFMGVILAALIFGIVNTMLMAVLERVKELGMLMAVGMNKIRVFTMILLETVLLSLTGGIIGIVTGYVVTLFFSIRGINLSSFADAYARMGYESLIYPVPNIDIDLKVSIMVFFTGIIASIYPAWKAIHLKPAEALRVDV